MYAYNLLVHTPGSSNPAEWEPVRPGPDMEIPTVERLKVRVLWDIGYVPEWLATFSGKEYLQVEEEVQIRGMWFCLDIEGSDNHVLPSVAQRIALKAQRGK